MKRNLLPLILLGLTTLPVSAQPTAPAASPCPDGNLIAALAAPGDRAKGETAYRTCRGCHKADGGGRTDGIYPQLAGQHASVLVKQVLDVRAGRRDSHKMDPFIEEDTVPGGQITHIATYLSCLPTPTENGKGSGRDLARGKTLYQRDCASCHGDQGEGDAARFYPVVAGQHYAYLRRESVESRDLGRRNANAEMVKVIKPYSDQDIDAVSDYMSRLVAPAKSHCK